MNRELFLVMKSDLAKYLARVCDFNPIQLFIYKLV